MKLRNVSGAVLFVFGARNRVDLKGREGWPAYVGVCGGAELNNRDLSKRHSPETISIHGGTEDPCALTSTYLLPGSYWTRFAVRGFGACILASFGQILGNRVDS